MGRPEAARGSYSRRQPPSNFAGTTTAQSGAGRAREGAEFSRGILDCSDAGGLRLRLRFRASQTRLSHYLSAILISSLARKRVGSGRLALDGIAAVDPAPAVLGRSDSASRSERSSLRYPVLARASPASVAAAEDFGGFSEAPGLGRATLRALRDATPPAGNGVVAKRTGQRGGGALSQFNPG